MNRFDVELRKHAIDEFRYLHSEAKDLLDAKEEDEYNEKVLYSYYKNPFDNTECSVEKELIIFTNNGRIIQLKPVYNEDNRFFKIDISALKTEDINRIDFNTNFNEYNTNKSLIIRFDDLSVLELKNTDINDNWKRDNSTQIKEIAKFLLR